MVYVENLEALLMRVRAFLLDQYGVSGSAAAYYSHPLGEPCEATKIWDDIHEIVRDEALANLPAEDHGGDQ